MHTRRLMLIDSKWRRVSQCPDPWAYAVALPEPIKNVVAVDLVSAIMPNTQRTVNRFNSKFQITPDGRNTVTVDIPQGNYEPALLLSTLQQLLQDAGVANPIFTYAADTNIVTFTSDLPFSLPFSSGDANQASIHEDLGFGNTDVVGVTTVTAPFAMLLPPPSYVTVDLPGLPWDSKNRSYIQQGDSVSDPRMQLSPSTFLGVVTLDTDYQTFKYWKASSQEVMRQTFPPIDLRQIAVELRDDKGNLYDSNGYDHTLVLEVTQLLPSPPPQMCPGNNRLPGPSAWGVNCQYPFAR